MARRAEHDDPCRSDRILVTIHRRESWGPRLDGLCAGVAEIARRHPHCEIVFPSHPNPAVRDTADRILGGMENVVVCDALDYEEFIGLLAGSHLVLTDSGGIQEEAPSLGVPVLVLRDRTERREGLAAGTAKLVGTDPDTVVRAVDLLLADTEEWHKMAELLEPWRDQVAYTDITCGGSLARGLGLALAAAGRFGDAVDAFEQALQMNAKLQAPILVARTELDFALATRDRDPVRSRDLAESARATAERLGLETIRRRTTQLLEER